MMALLRSLFVALALTLAWLAPAKAQQFPTVPSGTVIGRTQAGSGPAQAIPFSTLIATMLASSPTIPTINTSTILYAGSSSGTATVKAQAVAGTPTIQWPNTSGTVADNATTPIVLNSTTGNISCPTCGLSLTRAASISTDLHTFSTFSTSGYSTAGDGGQARFVNVGSAAFLDSQVVTLTVTGNGTSGCSAGVFAFPSGGTGHGLHLAYTVSGGVVTVAAPVDNGGNGYTVGDVLSTTISGCSTTVTVTVASVTTPTASFTDSAGTHWQYAPDASGTINVKQFGAACNWTSTAGDAGSTNDTTAIQNALNFAANTVQPTIDAGGVAGQMVFVPFGNCLSGSLTVPYGVTLSGINAWSSQIKFTDAMSAAGIPITVCDSTTHLACFGSRVINITLRGGSGTANANVPMVFSNSLQQMAMLWRVAFYPGQRGCLQYDTGYGGAAQVGFVEVECTMSSTGNPGYNFTNMGSTLVYLKNTNAEFGGSGVSANGFQAGSSGGFFDIDNMHCEGVSVCIFWNNTSGIGAGALRVHNASGGAHCTDLVLKQSGSTASDMVVGMAVPNGCTNTVLNGATPTTTAVIPDTTY